MSQSQSLEESSRKRKGKRHKIVDDIIMAFVKGVTTIRPAAEDYLLQDLQLPVPRA